MLRHVEKVLVIVFLVIASVLWWPLLKWHRVFESSPAVVFAVPDFQSLPSVESSDHWPNLPPLRVVELSRLNVTELKTLQTSELPVFQNHQKWQIGPYLQLAEAQVVAEQVTQSLKIPVTIVDYRLSGEL